ncbi:hypothetical protein [Shigella phage ESH35]|nr:hypothetical protein [Shigella phage ESH35]
MLQLTEKQLRNLTVLQLDEIRREVGNIISALRREVSLNQSPADYTRLRNFENTLIKLRPCIGIK